MANQDQIAPIRDQPLELAEAEGYPRIVAILEDLHGADQADLIEELERPAQEAIVRLMRPNQLRGSPGVPGR